MNILEARAAIEAILAALPDSALPDFDRIETEPDGTTVAWWGSCGYHLGSTYRGTERRPLNYRERASWAAIEQEMVYRADLAHLKGEEKSA